MFNYTTFFEMDSKIRKYNRFFSLKKLKLEKSEQFVESILKCLKTVKKKNFDFHYSWDAVELFRYSK